MTFSVFSSEFVEAHPYGVSFLAWALENPYLTAALAVIVILGLAISIDNVCHLIGSWQANRAAKRMLKAAEAFRDGFMDDGYMDVQLDKGAYMPELAHETDAGFDLRAVEGQVVPARGSAVFDTGVHIALPKKTAGVLISKSGLNVNQNITSTGLIDENYTGSVRVKLYNKGDYDYTVNAGDKISQLVIVPVVRPKPNEVDALGETERGDGGFGSTGR